MTITLSDGAIDALRVLSMVDMRSKSQQIEYLILTEVERRNITPAPAFSVNAKTEEYLVGNYNLGDDSDGK